MPEQALWESFFDPAMVLDQLSIDHSVNNAVEFGCGYGTFTLPAAGKIAGTLHALDLDRDMIATACHRAERLGVNNITFSQRDFVAEGAGIDDASVDYAMVFNLLHCEHPVSLLREARRTLRSGGRVGVIHWLHDQETPRGPPMEMRPTPTQIISWGKRAGLEPAGEVIDLPPYHFGLVLEAVDGRQITNDKTRGST